MSEEPAYKKWLNRVLSILPILALLGSSLLWVDARYIHRDISDKRYIELQIKIIQGHTRGYERLKDQGASISATETANYKLDTQQLDYLMKERNKSLGLN